jgi:tetratricopeptide (TPR) repeat protein
MGSIAHPCARRARAPGTAMSDQTGTRTAPRTGYAADLAALRGLLAERGPTAEFPDAATASEVLGLRHREVLLSGGRPADLIELGREIDRAIDRFPACSDLRLLRATVALAVHRPDIARVALDAGARPAVLPPGQVLAADLAHFEGDYAAARAGYLAALRTDPRWSTQARLAALARATGSIEESDDRYVLAEDQIAGTQLHAVAWVRVQRADLALVVGDPGRAERYLADADLAYPGWWYVTAARAALDLALGRPLEAADGYRRVLSDVDRPEFREALGTALTAGGKPEQGAVWHHAALAEYRASVSRGEAHSVHHLAAYYADVDPDPEQAVGAARQEVRMRRSGATLSLLAWCLHRAGRTEEAWSTTQEAFALGAGDPVLVERARLIRLARGAD